MKYKILLSIIFVSAFTNEANAQPRDIYTDITMTKKVNTLPLSTKIAANKILYQIDSVYYDNDSTTALQAPPMSAFKKDSTKKYSSVFDRDGLAPYVSKEVPDPKWYTLLSKIITIKKDSLAGKKE